MRIKRHALLATLALLLIPLGVMGLRPTLAAADAHAAPFTGTFSGTAILTGPTLASFSGKGIATHMGASANVGYSVITGLSDVCPNGLANNQYETLTAANGDTLSLLSYDVGCPMGPGQFHGTGRWVVTGGTGQFSGVSGHGTLDGHSNFNLQVFSVQLTGTITLPQDN